MKVLGFGLLVVLFYSCSCKYYDIGNKYSADTFRLLGSNRPVYPCNRRESITLGTTEEAEYYKVNGDSTAFGHVAVICYDDRKSLPHIRVGAGSEFEVGGCEFRVLKVYHPYYDDTINNKVFLANKLAVQVLSYPKHCYCKNKILKTYDEAGWIENWEYRVFKK